MGKSSINSNLAKRIKALRLSHGLTQEQLAEKIKTSYKYMQRLESKNPPDMRVSTLERLSLALKTTPDKLLDF